MILVGVVVVVGAVSQAIKYRRSVHRIPPATDGNCIYTLAWRLARAGQGREWHDMPHNYACPAEGASFLLLFLLCWLLRQRRQQQLCMPTHVHEHTRTCTHTHTHFLLNPCHIEVSNMATSVDGTNHLVSKRLQTRVSTHNCAVCVNIKNVVKADWNSLKVSPPSPLAHVPRPQLGPRAEPTC